MNPRNCTYMFGKNRKKVLLLTDDLSATYYLGFYHCLLSQKSSFTCRTLARQDIINSTTETTPDIFFENLLTLEKPELVIFNRYSLPHGELIIEKCQQYSIKTVYFIDDDQIGRAHV